MLSLFEGGFGERGEGATTKWGGPRDTTGGTKGRGKGAAGAVRDPKDKGWFCYHVKFQPLGVWNSFPCLTSNPTVR